MLRLVAEGARGGVRSQQAMAREAMDFQMTQLVHSGVLLMSLRLRYIIAHDFIPDTSILELQFSQKAPFFLLQK